MWPKIHNYKHGEQGEQLQNEPSTGQYMWLPEVAWWYLCTAIPIYMSQHEKFQKDNTYTLQQIINGF